MPRLSMAALRKLKQVEHCVQRWLQRTKRWSREREVATFILQTCQRARVERPTRLDKVAFVILLLGQRKYRQIPLDGKPRSTLVWGVFVLTPPEERETYHRLERALRRRYYGET
jgi:hypothetical protein